MVTLIEDIVVSVERTFPCKMVSGLHYIAQLRY